MKELTFYFHFSGILISDHFWDDQDHQRFKRNVIHFSLKVSSFTKSIILRQNTKFDKNLIPVKIGWHNFRRIDCQFYHDRNNSLQPQCNKLWRCADFQSGRWSPGYIIGELHRLEDWYFCNQCYNRFNYKCNF